VKRRKAVLDYSSPTEEQRRERKQEDERREAVERYDEAAFGERRPVASRRRFSGSRRSVLWGS
jgi:hypothetical protein